MTKCEFIDFCNNVKYCELEHNKIHCSIRNKLINSLDNIFNEKIELITNLLNNTIKRVGKNSDGCRKDLAKINDIEYELKELTKK